MLTLIQQIYQTIAIDPSMAYSNTPSSRKAASSLTLIASHYQQDQYLIIHSDV
ncbi:hypothetical protein M0L20_25325 [Spirosoma sp. RP8]|uniref:Uncharacterized protein n=1 Tax=Spirosoma liriopis TaxID=2937440 RepID=A0ABT0HTR0_9BACT|nr:hypothetical protein [Spirosoma liriopis]MCK8495217.1 hypothetical protein [Spirosoma liriopis]